MTDSSPAALIGRNLGERTVEYTQWDAILYALAIGARADDLDLVFEERLRVLPSFVLSLAQWAPDTLAQEGVYGPHAVHGAQTLEVKNPLPRSGSIRMSARVDNVWDKGTAAVFEVTVDSELFIATWTIFAPGLGGYGGQRGPQTIRSEVMSERPALPLDIAPNQAALYRLLGDHHHIHIDPAAAQAIGYDRPILHGLCSLAAATLPLAKHAGAHPADLTYLSGRFTGPAFPGDSLRVVPGDVDSFTVAGDGGEVISNGIARFA